MELQFKKDNCSFLKPVLREVQNQEQTMEMKLSDGMPDIGRVLSAWGQVVLRSKDWRTDSVGLSGGVLVWVLYAPEDGTQPRCIDSWIPFQMRWNLTENVPEGTIRIASLLRFVDARTVSARKIMVRTGIAALAEVFSPMNASVYVPDNIPEGIELLKNRYPIRLPREAGEKSFVMDEEFSVPPSVPQPEKLLYYTVRPQVTDQKVMGNKIVFRGNLNLHILYVSEEDQFHNWDFELPFSQYAELNGNYGPEAEGNLVVCTTNLELELEDEGHLRLKAGVVGQYVIEDIQLLELIEDAYSPGRELELHKEMLELPVILENRMENIYGEQTISANGDLIVDVQFLPDFPQQHRRANGIQMELPGTFQVLYYGENGALRGANSRWQGQCEVAADAESEIFATPIPAIPRATLGSGNMVAAGEVPLQMTTTSARGMSMVTGIALGQRQQPDPQRPSLILRRAGEERLWDIAKASGSTMDSIRKANNLSDEPAPGQMLLIPVL